MSVLADLLKIAPAGFEYEFLMVSQPFKEMAEDAAQEVAYEHEEELTGKPNKHAVSVISMQPEGIDLSFQITIFMTWCQDCHTVHFEWVSARPSVLMPWSTNNSVN